MSATPEKTESWDVAMESSSLDSDAHLRHQQLLAQEPASGLIFTGLPWLHHEDGWKAGLKDVLVNYFPRYKLKRSGTVYIDERPTVFHTIAYGIQHALAMFSGTIVIPIAMGFDPNTSLFFSGISTIIFFICTGGRVPSYLGSSGSVISAVLAVTGYNSATSTTGMNENIPVAQGGIIVLALLYMFISLLVIVFGYKWVEFLMPPIVTGGVVAGIGLHLGYSAFNQATATPFDFYMALTTVLAIMLISVYAPLPSLRRVSILLGLIVGYVIHIICGVTGAGYPVDFSDVSSVAWVRGPIISGPIVFDKVAISTIAPIVIVIVAENMGHIKAISSLTGTPMEKYLGRAYLGDAISTLMAGCVGASPLTTYAENIGVLSVTRIYSPVVILVAAITAIIVGFISKFGAVVRSIPDGVFGGTTLVLYSLIAITGIRVWVMNRIDFSDPRNVFVGGIPLILAAVMTEKTLVINDFQLDAVGASTFASIILYQVLRGYDGYKEYCMWIKRQYRYYKYGKEEQDNNNSALPAVRNDSIASSSEQHVADEK
ncbi:permease family-domain-containing protein [Zychaea mexicana]|uniref:permease family-domain-containing protein n=1 Tax=Zychaea mexicana TaxID=64656 RepID=UPI0022FEEC94|nr:permease family-domain-containing protein [Zychaea mexicana]KAI9490726.1 permease family-domain-containing protein [Zychaea mexicana]